MQYNFNFLNNNIFIDIGFRLKKYKVIIIQKVISILNIFFSIFQKTKIVHGWVFNDLIITLT